MNRAPGFSLLLHLSQQRRFSAQTFGPGARRAGVLAHIRKELDEIEASGKDMDIARADAESDLTTANIRAQHAAEDEHLFEWIDVVILALDGALRAGFSPTQIVNGLIDKQEKNQNRKWPDWRTLPADAPIEHDRSHDVAA